MFAKFVQASHLKQRIVEFVDPEGGMARKRLTKDQELTIKYIEKIEKTTGESDRGHVIVAAAQAEEALENLLRAFLVDDKGVDELFDGPFAPLSDLSAKARVSFFLGLITREELKNWTR